MRKGILSLSPLGRRKASAKPKTSNMELAEKAAAKKAEEPQEQKKASAEKAYVQTIMVPKSRKSGDVKPAAKTTKSRKLQRKK